LSAQLQKDGKELSVFGPGIKGSDLRQGELGTCYVLATFAAVANLHPGIIENMFIDRDLWDANVFVTKWLLSGRETTVAVDDTFPMDVTNHYWRLFFVSPSDGAGMWPVLLEKAWAKIFGSFKGVEGGMPIEIFRAMTQAPAYRLPPVGNGFSKDDYWAALKAATDAKHPVVAGTGHSANYGLARGHAYTVFRAYEGSHGRMVELYNPWHRDFYSGSVPNSNQNDGRFSMTLDEFLSVPFEADVAHVEPGYRLSGKSFRTRPYYTGAGALQQQDWTVKMVKFSLKQSGKVYFQLEFPSARMVEKHCGDAHGRAISASMWVLAVQKGSEQPQLKADWNGNQFLSFKSVDVSGPGDFTVFVYFAFENADWLREFTVNVYAGEDTFVEEIPRQGSLCEQTKMSMKYSLPNHGQFDCDQDRLPTDSALAS